MMPVLLTILVLFGLNWAWTVFLTPLFAGLFGKPLYGLLIDALLKSALFVVLGLGVLYKLKVSRSINDLIDRLLKRF